MGENPNVTVLMSTYNGQKYLRQQIDSILQQTGVNVRLIIRDDCSKDNTQKILDEYEATHKNIKIIAGKKNLGACRSFLSLIRSYDDDEYFALSDQDDIWNSDKIECAVSALKSKKSNRPLLYYSNLNIVDEDGNYCRKSHKKPHIGTQRYSALSENLATGCTIVYNNALAKIAVNAHPEEYSMHDAWLYLVAKIFGETVYDFEPHINYRQHDNNEVGTYKNNVDKKKIVEQIHLIRGDFGKIWSNNAKIFYKQFFSLMSDRDKKKILKFVHYNDSLRSKIKLLNDREYFPDDKYRRLKLAAEILLGTL